MISKRMLDFHKVRSSRSLFDDTDAATTLGRRGFDSSSFSSVSFFSSSLSIADVNVVCLLGKGGVEEEEEAVDDSEEEKAVDGSNDDDGAGRNKNPPRTDARTYASLGGAFS